MGDGRVGVIFGNVGSTECDVAVIDPSLMRLEYVELEHESSRLLGVVQETTLDSNLSYEAAKAGEASVGGRHMAHVRVLGYRDRNGRVQVPRTPLGSGIAVYRAGHDLIRDVLGLKHQSGAPLGRVRGLDLPVHLDLNVLAQKHLSVLAKTGAGKSYTVGVILESFLLHQVPMVILDPHGEYGSLGRPNMAERDLKRLTGYGLKPKSFQASVKEFAADPQVMPEARPFKLSGVDLTAKEIAELLPQKLQASQMGVLYQAVKDAQEAYGSYALEDVREQVELGQSTSKWNVLGAIDSLLETNLFHHTPTPIQDLVKPNQASILNLKGVGPDLQEVVAARLLAQLWEARKRGSIPPLVLVVEEAHNFCPERGMGNAMSGPILRTIAAEGRKFGLGLVIVSQRPAKIDKNVLSQCNTQVVLKVTNPNDLKAIISSVEGITNETADEIQRLNVGQALVAGGGLLQPVFVEVRPRLSAHGGDSIEVIPAEEATPNPFEEMLPKPAPTARTRRAAVSPPPEPVAAPKQAPEPIHDPKEDGFEPVVREEPSPAPAANAPAQEPTTFRPAPSSSSASPEPPEGIHAALARARSYDVPDTPAKPKVKAKDLARVAARVGLIAVEDPGLAQDRLTQIARGQGVDEDRYLEWYQQIADHACLEQPKCIFCPLQDRCEDHQSRQRSRHAQRSPVRRLWRRS